MIVHKSTGAPFSSEYDDFYEDGIYVCRRCNAPLYLSENKFDAEEYAALRKLRFNEIRSEKRVGNRGFRRRMFLVR